MLALNRDSPDGSAGNRSRLCASLLDRYFPFGLSLEPIRARSVVIITRCAPPVSNVWEILRIFFTTDVSIRAQGRTGQTG